MTKPQINVTPLIDVLLVLLIIFMVVTPLKPSSFDAKIPHEPQKSDASLPDPRTLVVIVQDNAGLSINHTGEFGTVSEPEKMTEKLSETFRLRAEAAVASALDPNRIERTVFIKAPRNASYGNVAKVVDAVKASGASPISLMIDELN